MQERKNDIDHAQIFNSGNLGIVIFRRAVIRSFNKTGKARKQAHAAQSRHNRRIRGRAKIHQLRVIIHTHPLPIARNSNGKDIKALTVKSMKNTGSRRTRDQVFAGASTKNNKDARTFDFTHGVKITARIDLARTVRAFRPAQFSIHPSFVDARATCSPCR